MAIPSIKEALEPFESHAFGGSDNKLKLQAILNASCADKVASELNDLTTQLAENAKKSDSLSNRVFWLNVILTGATVALAVDAFISP